MRELADACDADERCACFDFDGNLRDEYSPVACRSFATGKQIYDGGGGSAFGGGGGGSGGGGSGSSEPARWRPPLAFARLPPIMYCKDLSGISGAPRKVVISEFALALPAESSPAGAPIDEVRPSRLPPPAGDSTIATAAPPGGWCVSAGCDAAGASPPPATWWRLENADVVGCDLRRADPSAGGRIATDDVARRAHWLRSECAADARCACVNSAGWLKSSCDVTDIFAAPSVETTLWSRVPLPPTVDYLVSALVSLARELQLASAGACGLPLLSARELLQLEGFGERELAALNLDLDAQDSRITGEGDEEGFLAANPGLGSGGARSWSGADSPPMDVREAHANGVRAILRPPRGVDGLDAPLRTHVFIVDTGRLDQLHEAVLADDALPEAAWAGDAAAIAALSEPARRGAARRRALASRLEGASEDYWFTAFAWLRRRFGASPCFSFVPATSYVRVSEAMPPAFFRGDPRFHVDNALKGASSRGEFHQQLDFVSALRFGAARAPDAHLAVLEDDSLVCPETLPAIARAVRALDLADPLWGGLKLGNGGSGIVVHRELAAGLILYLQTRRGSENVDVAMWRFMKDMAWSEYLAYGTRVAHRGAISSFSLQKSDGQRWGHAWSRARCGAQLDFHWGTYDSCNGAEAARRAGARGAGPPLASAAGDWLERQFRCSRESPFTTWRPGGGDGGD